MSFFMIWVNGQAEKRKAKKSSEQRTVNYDVIAFFCIIDNQL